MAKKNKPAPDGNNLNTPVPRPRAARRRTTSTGPSVSSQSRETANDGATSIGQSDAPPASYTAARSDAASASRYEGPSYEEIAEVAYHRYLSRGGNDGLDFDDWIEAERQLRRQRDADAPSLVGNPTPS